MKESGVVKASLSFSMGEVGYEDYRKAVRVNQRVTFLTVLLIAVVQTAVL